MKIIDAYILARTKRKTRRIRTALVTLVSALLFAILFFGGFIVDGLQKSAEQFKDVGFNSRFITTVFSGAAPGYDYGKIEAETKAQMDAELRARNIRVDDSVRNSLEYVSELSSRMSLASTAEEVKARKALEERIAQEFNPKAVYHLERLNEFFGVKLRSEKDSDPYLTQAQRGLREGMSPYDPQDAEFHSIESAMIDPLLAEGQTLDWQPGQPYPVLLPYSYVARIADRSMANLSPKESTAAHAQLIRDYAGKELTYCYRNPTAMQQLSAALEYNKLAQSDKDPATKPIPIEPCQPLDQAVLKKAGIIQTSSPDAPKPLFPPPPTPAPATRDIKVKIVGFVPTDERDPNANFLISSFKSVNTWPASLPALIPAEVIAQDASVQNHSEQKLPPALFIESASREDQKKILDKSCSAEECMQPGSLFVAPFGSVRVAVEGTLEVIGKATNWVVLVIAFLAGLMIMLTISKIIADSRNEIAVFRALGARRRDIAQIYFTYGFMLAGSSLVVSVALAAVAALVFSRMFAPDVNIFLVEATGAFTLQTHTSLFGASWLWLLGIAGLLFVASFIGILIPVLLSNRKNLVDVMRDE